LIQLPDPLILQIPAMPVIEVLICTQIDRHLKTADLHYMACALHTLQVWSKSTNLQDHAVELLTVP